MHNGIYQDFKLKLKITILKPFKNLGTENLLKPLFNF